MVTFIVAIITVSLQFIGTPSGLLGQVEHTLKDSLWRNNVLSQPEKRLLIVDIDEDSLAQIGPWPWPRAILADLLEALVSQGGVQAIGLDMVLPSPADSSGDTRLQAISQQAPVVWGQVFDLIERPQAIASGTPSEGSGPWSGQFSRATGYLANHAGLAQSPCTGQISSVLDADGVVRRLPLVVGWQTTQHLSLSLAMLECAKSTSTKIDQLLSSVQTPLWEIQYRRHTDTYSIVSAAHILEGTSKPSDFNGRWILVGSSALGLNDTVTTPLNASVPGVMVHAQALSYWLDTLQRVPASSWPQARSVAVAWSLLSLGVLVWAMARWRAWLLLPMVALCTGAWLGVIAPQLLQLGRPFSVSAPLLGYVTVLLLVPLAWWLAQRERRQLVHAFSTYVAPEVLDTMLREGLDKPLTPRHARITVLSADMENYTGLTAGSSLQAAAQLTRGFLQCITDPLLKHQGTLDKYTGDGLVAFWGAPLPAPDAPNKAILTAIEMAQAVRQWNKERLAQGQPPARVRIGIETGNALVGDLGTSLRSTYTAVGNCINRASKIQAAARHKPHDILVGQDAAQAITVVPMQWVMQLPWGDQREPTNLYAPTGVPTSVPETEDEANPSTLTP